MTRGGKRFLAFLLCGCLTFSNVAFAAPTSSGVEAEEQQVESETQDGQEEVISVGASEQEELVSQAEEKKANKEESEAQTNHSNTDRKSDIASGSYYGIPWVIDANGKLTVEGEGDLSNMSSWNDLQDHREEVKTAALNVKGTQSLSYSFSGFSNLESVDLSQFDSSQLKDTRGMFFGCKKLVVTNLNGLETSQVTDMSSMFAGCASLESLDISNFATSQGTSMYCMFSGCTSLQKVALPSDLQSIQYGMFSGCSSLASIAIPDGCTSIEEGAFMDLEFLMGISIPETVTQFGKGSIRKWPLLTIYGKEGSRAESYAEALEIPFSTEPMPEISIREGVSGNWKYKTDGKAIYLTEYTGEETKITVPKELDGKSVVYMKNDMFSHKDSITDVDIQAELTFLPNNCFKDWPNLSRVTLPSTLKKIAGSAFGNNEHLCGVSIPKSVEEIDSYCFYNSPLLTIYGEAGSYAESFAKEHQIPFSTEPMPDFSVSEGTGEDWKYIAGGNYVYLTEYVGDATEITIPKELNGKKVSTVKAGMFEDNDKITGVDIQAELVTLPSGFFYGCTSLSKVILPEQLKQIEGGAFDKCSALKEIEFPDGLEQIGDYAFSGCASLKKVVIPDSIVDRYDDVEECTIRGLGEECFCNCTSLEEVEFQKACEYVANYMFSGCTSLSKVILPEQLKWIGEEAFSGCSSLEEIELPDGLKKIGFYAFRGCASLKKVEIPDSVVDTYNEEEGETICGIGSSCFSGCSSLEEVKLPDGLTMIASEVFKNCPKLLSVQIPSTVTGIGEEAFADDPAVVLSCINNDYAVQYAKDNNIKYADIRVAGDGSGLEVNISQETINKLQEGQSLSVVSGEVKAQFNAAAAGNIRKDAKRDVKLTYAPVKAGSGSAEIDKLIAGGCKVFELSLTDAEKNVIAFNKEDGACTVTVPYVNNNAEAAPSIYFIGENQKLQKLNGEYDSKNATMTFVTTQFSKFVIGFVSEEGQEPDTPDTPDTTPKGFWTEGNESSMLYTGTPVTFPNLKVYFGKKLLTEGTDYTVKYTNNIKPADSSSNAAPTLTITGKGDYSGNKVIKFSIEPVAINADVVKVGSIQVAAGTKAVPVLCYNGMLLKAGTHYTYDTGKKWTTSDNGQMLTVTAKEGNGFTGTRDIPVVVVEKKNQITGIAVAVDTKKLPVYSGQELNEEIKKAVLVYDKKDKSKTPLGADKYEIVMAESIVNAGKYQITVIGKDTYGGSVNKTITIKSCKGITLTDQTPKDVQVMYRPDGAVINDVICIQDSARNTLVRNKDYKVTYSNNKAVSKETKKAKYKITFLGNYAGNKAITGEFVITPADFSEAELIVEDMVTYKKPGNYKGKVTVKDQGSVLKNSDYTVKYILTSGGEGMSNKNKLTIPEGQDSATIKAVITGKGNYSAQSTLEKEFTVYRSTAVDKDHNMTKAVVTVKNPTMQYTGEELTNEVTVTINGKTVDPKDYEVHYVNNKKKGKATIIVAGKNDYHGCKRASFKIVSFSF